MKNNSICKKIKSILQKRKIDYVFNTVTSAVSSFVSTVFFALYNGFLGIYLMSIWHGSICVFYLLLVFIRGIILIVQKRSCKISQSENEHIRYIGFLLSCTMLLFLNLALICPIALMVTFKRAVNMSLFLAIASAAYTTYNIIIAIINFQKQKRKNHNNILVEELRTINLINSLISILTLQNTLIMVKSNENSADNMLTLSAISSAAVYVLIVFITLRLLIKGVKQHKNYNL
ncbi:MAG: hypothetical protein LIO62_01880 [Clostridiales bacterium]|nr:hypothetical protein [Clostridiales bacterium]